MYESMVFYRSFYEALKDLEPEMQNEVYNAIFLYGLYGELPENMSPVAKSIFTLIKPQIDANNRRKENGKKGAEYGKLGGRPPKEPLKEDKKTPKKPLKNPTQTPNVNVNANVNVNVKRVYGEYSHVKLKDEELEKLHRDFGKAETDKAIKFLDEYIEEKDYKSKSHYMALRRWVFDAVKERNKGKKLGFNDFQQSDTNLDEMEKLFLLEVNRNDTKKDA